MKRDYLYSLFFRKTDAQELRYGNAIGHTINRYREISQTLLEEKEKLNARGKLLGLLYTLPDLLFLPVLSVYIVICIAKQILTLGDLSYVSGIYSSLSSSIIRMTGDLSAICQYNARIRDFRSYYSYIDKETPASHNEIDVLTSVEFLDVSFKYPGRDEYVLKHLSLKLSAGVKTAIVGLNGSGKTTIFKLLCGFYKPESGRILINGQNLYDLNIASVRRHMAVLFQDYTIYQLSIRDNVTVSVPDHVSKEDSPIREALDMAGFHHAEYDRQKDCGLSIGREFSQDGIVLSGGQEQQLALARALYRNADLLLLDEPSSSLDPESEYFLLQNLERHYHDKLLVMITHKLYNTKRADLIYCIENGLVAESGSHHALLAQRGLYYQMFTVQNKKENFS